MSADVFVAGATGNLGSKIVAELVERGATVRALVRKGKADGGDALRELVAAGKVDLVVGDLTEAPAVLAEHLKGVHIVVSAVQGDGQVIIDGQANLLAAAEAAGVARMIPSDFSADLHRLDYGDNAFLDMRKIADAAFGQSTVKPTSVLIGGFMEVMLSPFMGIVDHEHHTFSYWGDGEQPIDLTSIPDAAAYTAAVALDDTTAGRIVSFAGAVLTINQFHAELERATGSRFDIRQLGTVDDLLEEITRRKTAASSPFEYVALQYQWAMVSGKGKLRTLNNNDYPDIVPATLAQLLSAR